MNIHILFPIHLFSNIELLKKKDIIYLVEEPRFFIDFKYHKLKIAYHRATMKSYYLFLEKNNINIKYINFIDVHELFYKNISLNNRISIYNPNDDTLLEKINKWIPHLQIFPTLNFLVEKDLLNDHLSIFYKNGKYNHNHFYKWQRKRLNILIEKNGKPLGGSWTFDKENREKIPKDKKIPEMIHLHQNKENSLIMEEAKNYTNEYFKDNYGYLDNFIFPINHKESNQWLEYFLKTKFKDFGKYEDAESIRDPFLFHSVLTPMMNIGLLTDNEVLKKTLKYQDKIPLSSFEGFIRQIIGWRNYVYAIYLLEGTKLSTYNFFNHKNKINKKILWEGKTNIVPIDNIIQKILNFGYAHHIERLMYLGNYLLICMINPKIVYEIFMEWTIDSYEWVMMPNVYGMSQFADGGLIMTRPYFCSSNYILKMSDYKKENWCKIMDSLYYHFIHKHKKYLSSNYATSRQVAFWKKKTDAQKKEILHTAKKYLNNILTLV